MLSKRTNPWYPPRLGEDSDCRRINEPYKHRWGVTTNNSNIVVVGTPLLFWASFTLCGIVTHYKLRIIFTPALVP